MSATTAAFYFDLASPLAYLAAERALHVLPGAAEWQPVLARELARGESPDRDLLAPEHELFRAQVAARAQELGLQPLRWPEPFPFDSALAMRVATYAKSIGRLVPFAQAAFRQAFAGGHSLEDPDFVVIAAAACEMHPTAVLRAAELRSVGEQLRRATATAARLGVREVPAVLLAEEGHTRPVQVFLGERALEDAAARMGAGLRGSGAR